MAEKKDLSTAILDNRKGPNKLKMEQIPNDIDDNSICVMTQNKMDELKIYTGETVILKGKKRKETVCTVIASADEQQDDKEIRTNKCVRRNIRCSMGDDCMVKPLADCPNGVKIHVLPFADTIEGVGGNITQDVLVPYFKQAFRPVQKGDCFVAKLGIKNIEFKIVDVDPREVHCQRPVHDL